jgi:hypothetical protein
MDDAMLRAESPYRAVLSELRYSFDAEGQLCFISFDPLARLTGLDRKTVRRACRALRRKGFAQFGRGLWTDDGEPAGSGYAITRAGVAALDAIEADTKGRADG